MKKLLVISVMMIALIISSVAFAYTDVKSDHWAFDAISKWSKEEVLLGYKDGTFKPENYITKAEFSSILVRLFEFVKTTDLSKYKDVKFEDWYYENMSKALASGVITEDTATTLRPGGLVTRQEATVMLNSVLKEVAKNGIEEIKKYTDYDEIGDYAEKDVEAFVESTRLVGYTDGSIKPVKPITRAEVTALLDRIFVYIAKTAGTYDMSNSNGVILVKAKDVVITNGSNSKVIFLNDEIKESTTGVDASKKEESIVINPENPVVPEETKPTTSSDTKTSGEKADPSKPASSGDSKKEDKPSSGGSSSGTTTKTAVLDVVTVKDTEDGPEYYKCVRNGVSVKLNQPVTIKVDGKVVDGANKLIVKENQAFMDALKNTAKAMDTNKIMNTLNTNQYINSKDVNDWGKETIAELVENIEEYGQIVAVAKAHPDTLYTSVYNVLTASEKENLKDTALGILDQAYNNTYPDQRANERINIDSILQTLNAFPNR